MINLRLKSHITSLLPIDLNLHMMMSMPQLMRIEWFHNFIQLTKDFMLVLQGMICTTKKVSRFVIRMAGNPVMIPGNIQFRTQTLLGILIYFYPLIKATKITVTENSYLKFLSDSTDSDFHLFLFIEFTREPRVSDRLWWWKHTEHLTGRLWNS